MRSNWMTIWILLVLFAVACAPRAAETTSPIPATPTPTSRTVSFTTPDGATMGGTLYGSGTTAVIFSVMGNCRRGWDHMARAVGQKGIMALTYQWRGCKESGSAVESEMRRFVDDLRGAISFIRSQGAEKIILVGASLGGCASAKLAVESRADGLIVLAAPSRIPEWDFEIEAADISSSIPKLFVTAENDDTVAAGRTQALFDLASDPKEWQTYPGTAHGTDLFKTASGDELQERILSFILAIAAKP